MTPPNPEPPKNQKIVTEALNTILVVVDEPGDTTPRPRSPNIPLDYPRPLLPPQPPPDEQQPPPADEKQPPPPPASGD